METSQTIYDEVTARYGEIVKSFIARTAVMTSLRWIEDPEEYVSFVDMMSIEAGKYNAIRRLSEKYPGEQIITVGDDMNDLEMIQGFDGYAMRNSTPEVLEIVRPGHIVESVAELLERVAN